MAIEKGGISTNGRPRWAWKYINYLPTIGFKHILHHVRGKTEYVPMAGDIAVYKMVAERMYRDIFVCLPVHNGALISDKKICMYIKTQMSAIFTDLKIIKKTND
jgi:hypothetical protein